MSWNRILRDAEATLRRVFPPSDGYRVFHGWRDAEREFCLVVQRGDRRIAAPMFSLAKPMNLMLMEARRAKDSKEFSTTLRHTIEKQLPEAIERFKRWFDVGEV